MESTRLRCDMLDARARLLQNEVAAKERMETMWKSEQERRAKAGEDYALTQKNRALVEQVPAFQSTSAF